MRTKEENIQFLRKDVRDVYSRLTPRIAPKWGKMDAQQMLEHLRLAVKVSTGKVDVELSTPIDKIEKLKRIALLSDRALPLDFQNPLLSENPFPYEFQGFGQARGALWEEVDYFFDFFEKQGNSYKRTHNVFGELDYEEWLMFHYKHFMHHAMQFGLVPQTDKL